VAFVAHAPGDDDADAWRQLLFAASGLRHHLGTEGPTAYGTPLVVAIVDPNGERVLRRLVEDLAYRYAVFSRVDVNLVREEDLTDTDALDTALAPLLPYCRSMIGTTISRQDVRRFWQALRDNIHTAAAELDPIFGEHRERAADDLSDALIGSSDVAAERPSPRRIEWLRVKNFRSFDDARLDLAQATIVHGTNGSGKSSILEALELLWAHNSQRRPAGVPADQYAKHLPRGGSGAFAVRGRFADADEDLTVDSVSQSPQAEMARSVLTQEAITALVNAAPAERYASLLAVTGLEVPELDPRTKRLLDESKAQADAALHAAGLPSLPRANVRGLDHVRGALAGGFARKLPGTDDLATAERAVEKAAGGAYVAQAWSLTDGVVDAVVQADAEVDRLAADLEPRSDVVAALDGAADALRQAASPLRNAARPLRQLADALAARAPDDQSSTPAQTATPLPAALAARWASHSESVRESSARFRAEAGQLQDPKWASRLVSYADALDVAAATVPRAELERLARVASPTPTPSRLEPAALEAAFSEAGFRAALPQSSQLVALIEELQGQRQRQADALERLATELETHPARGFDGRSGLVLEAICRFEVARQLRRKGPIASASEDLLRELLTGRLYPVVRELVAAMVRFEWYFQPLRISVEGREVLLGGLATSRSDLDARMLLNSAERTVVGLAWFLALHLLQPPEQRQVLVLDDPAGAFDAVNRAGFVATLRAFVRLARPEQLVVATHDETVATMLGEELSTVEGWPSSIARVRCQRDEDDASVVLVEPVPEGAANLAAEEALLGLGGEPTLFGVR
jgi:energy-coupling factor transporter ATP-binding protein EcfA2